MHWMLNALVSMLIGLIAAVAISYTLQEDQAPGNEQTPLLACREAVRERLAGGATAGRWPAHVILPASSGGGHRVQGIAHSWDGRDAYRRLQFSCNFERRDGVWELTAIDLVPLEQ